MYRLVRAAAASVLLVGVGLVMVLSPAHARLSFTGCDKLNRQFPHGVARSRAAAERQLREGFGLPAYDRYAHNVFVANHRRLDIDRDGTACER